MMNKEQCLKALECIASSIDRPSDDVRKSYIVLKKLIHNHYVKGVRQPKAQYTVCDVNGKQICIGNIIECCECLNIDKDSFYRVFNATKHNIDKRKGKYTIFRLEEV